MTLIKSNQGIPSLLNDFFGMDRYFEKEFPAGKLFKTVPPVNIVEDESQFRVELAVPGMKKEDFKVNVENDLMTISAEKKEEKKEEKENFTRREYYYGSFERSFTLPSNSNPSKIEARYEDGVLKFFIPKVDIHKKNTMKEIMVH